MCLGAEPSIRVALTYVPEGSIGIAPWIPALGRREAMLAEEASARALRGHQSRRAARRGGPPKLADDQVTSILRMRKGGTPIAEIATSLDVSTPHRRAGPQGVAVVTRDQLDSIAWHYDAAPLHVRVQVAEWLVQFGEYGKGLAHRLCSFSQNRYPTDRRQVTA